MYVSFQRSDELKLMVYHISGYLAAISLISSPSVKELVIALAILIAVTLGYIPMWKKFKQRVALECSWRKDKHLRIQKEFQWGALSGLYFFLTAMSCVLILSSFTGYFDELLRPQALIVALLSILIWSSFVNFGGEFLHLLRAIKHSEHNLELNRSEGIKLKKEVLQDLISPHFIFNSLNTVSVILQENKAKSIRFVRELMDLYSFMLNDSHKSVIFLEEDLKLAKKYAYLLKTRLETGVNVDFSIPKQYYKCYLPPMTLQNLVENCVKHNAVTKKTVLNINIFIEGPYIVVKNNLMPKMVDSSKSTSLGLDYISTQVDQLIKEKVIVKKTDEEFIVKIPLIYEWKLLLNENADNRR